MDQKGFLDCIQACRRRLNLAGFLKNLAFALSVGAGVGIVFQAASLVIPLYYVNAYTGIALLAAVATAVVMSWYKRVTMKQAALVMDGFGFQERIITAYENLKEEGVMSALQRRDAIEQLGMHRDRIRIPLWPDRKKTVLMAALLAVMVGSMLLPSQVREHARELHQIQQEAHEKEEEIEEILEELEEWKALGQEVLTPEQLAAVQEMMESLQSSMTEYSQVSSAGALQAAGEKLDYKYGEMGSQMASLAQSLKSGATVSPMTAESMQAMADKLQGMSRNSSSGGNELASKQSQDGDSQSGQSGQGSGQNGQSSNGQSSGQSGQNSPGSGQGASGQSGQGGDQNGQIGQGSSQGGPGRGTGSADYAHDYVSIPNAIADSENLTGNVVDHDNSEYFRAQNGLSWEGTHMSYEEVIGSYEQNAYEGIASGRYPNGMEDVIKEYFSSFN